MPFVLSILCVVVFILYPTISSDIINWDLIGLEITSYILIILIVIFSITIFPDTMKVVKKDLLKLNSIVVNEDLTVSRAYNFIDMEHSSYSDLMIRLPKGTKFLDDFIETEIIKHGLKKEDANLIEQDLKQNCNLEEYNYVELKKILMLNSVS